jgi:hypothetical protein
MPLSAVWGDTTASSSDGQRFGLQASSLLGALYPPYVGYDDQALTVYTHLADQHSVFHPQAIACSVREAIHVLDELLANDIILRPKEPCVDQHGDTDQLFGLCHWLGSSLMPRLNVSQPTRSMLDPATSYGHLDAVCTGTIDVALIRQQLGPTGPDRRVAPQSDGTRAYRVDPLSQQRAVRSPGQDAHGFGAGAQDPLPLARSPRGTAPRADATPDQPG